MKSDVPSLAPPPPAPPSGLAPGPGTRPLSDVRTRTSTELVRDLEAVLQQGKPTLVIETAADGTTSVSSLVAVWLLNEVGKAIGVTRPVNLAEVEDRQELRSVGGVARLLHRALHPATTGSAP